MANRIILNKDIEGKTYNIIVNPKGGYVTVTEDSIGIISGQYIPHIKHLAIKYEDTDLIKKIGSCVEEEIDKREVKIIPYI